LNNNKEKKLKSGLRSLRKVELIRSPKIKTLRSQIVRNKKMALLRRLLMGKVNQEKQPRKLVRNR